MTKLDWSKFEPKFGTWAPKIKPFFTAGGFDPIYEELKKQAKEGIKIVPNSEDVFRAFRETKYGELTAVICGLCPYHTVINGECIADGLAMSCSKTGKLQPTLEKWYEAIEEEMNDGLCLQCEKTADLQFLAGQGVLLFNAALTTIAGKAKEHQELWAPFTKYLLENVISLTGVPVIFLGAEACAFSSFLAPMQHSFELHHPAYASYKNEKWDSKGVFKAVNKILMDSNGVEILWDLVADLPF